MFWLGTSFMNQATKQRLPFLPAHTRMPAHIQYAHTRSTCFSFLLDSSLLIWLPGTTPPSPCKGMAWLVRQSDTSSEREWTSLRWPWRISSLGKMSGSCLAASMVSNEAVPGFGTFFVRTASTYVTSEGHTFNMSSCMCLLFHHARLFYRILQHLVILFWQVL